jgi:hypothetical protein
MQRLMRMIANCSWSVCWSAPACLCFILFRQ